MNLSFKKVGVLGCGTMGSGITQVCAQSGYHVVVLETTLALVDRGIKRIADFLDKGLQKGKVTAEQKEQTLSRIQGTTYMDDLAECDIVVEAVIENADEKKKVFAQLDAIVKKDCIFASNTSCLSITHLAAATSREDKFCGLHFFSPAQIMKLVEVVRALGTSNETIKTACAFVSSIGKEFIVCKDTPGFVVNRLLIPYVNQAIQALDDGLASKEDIETALKLGLGYPMGPYTLMDNVGIDIHKHASEAIYEELHDKDFASPPLLRRMVNAGKLGKKSGEGFYSYKK